MKNTFIMIVLTALFLAAPPGLGLASGQEHIKRLDGVRSAMTELGNRMPELVKKSKPEDLRTLERIYEINNYALVTIESYLKMLKVAVTSRAGLNKAVVTILNGWLEFMGHYCEYDIKYFDEVLAQSKDEMVIKLVNEEKKNILALKDVSKTGILENIEFTTGAG